MRGRDLRRSLRDGRECTTRMWRSPPPPINCGHVGAFVIPDDIVSNNDIDTAIGALTKHIKTVVKRCQRKKAVIIGIPKPGKPRDLLTNYRPIRLLSGLGKLFEKVLKTQHNNHLLGNGLIINEQFGFRPNHSYPQQAL
ncbi:Probable RNA-directed DNA polymerase from transposon X-element [Eumeta japonica]|uniref:Probable RNA-directed DNA polymerase from transposon X-element n=1 Tax=Eumeta variegata TaxID=151549 RepID=A0A4C1VAC3_EUMVA|nr:Probable RNA-directed DNA polymerase from transposon X-element [Eumeta japonica]